MQVDRQVDVCRRRLTVRSGRYAGRPVAESRALEIGADLWFLLSRRIFFGSAIPLLIMLLGVHGALFAAESTIAAQDQGSSFAFVFRSGATKTFSLYGAHAPGRDVYLLDLFRDRFCKGRTHNVRDYNDGVDCFPITDVLAEGDCGAPKDYHVAFFEPVSQYRRVQLDPVYDSSLAESLQKRVRDSSALRSLRNKLMGTIREDPMWPLNSFSFRMYKIQISKADLYILSYESPESTLFGPRLVLRGDILYPLTGWCSYPYFHAFTLNGELYLESGSGCWGCGATVMEIFRVDDKEVTLVCFDASESD